MSKENKTIQITIPIEEYELLKQKADLIDRKENFYVEATTLTRNGMWVEALTNEYYSTTKDQTIDAIKTEYERRYASQKKKIEDLKAEIKSLKNRSFLKRLFS